MKKTPWLGHYIKMVVKDPERIARVEESLRRFYAKNDRQAGMAVVADGACSEIELYEALSKQAADRGDTKEVLRYQAAMNGLQGESIKSIRESIQSIRDFKLRYSKA